MMNSTMMKKARVKVTALTLAAIVGASTFSTVAFAADNEEAKTTGFHVSFVTEQEDVKAPETQIVENGEHAKATAEMKKEGYTFVGWFAEGSKEAFNFEKDTITSDIVLHAHWAKAEVKAEEKAAAKEAAEEIAAAAKAAAEKAAEEKVAAEKAAEEKAAAEKAAEEKAAAEKAAEEKAAAEKAAEEKAAAEKAAAEKAAAEKAAAEKAAAAKAAIKTLAAEKKADTYTVKFDANEGSGKMDSMTIKVDEKKSLKDNSFTRKGYTFAGWNTKADGKGTTVANKAQVKNLTKKNGETVTLYAQWKKATATSTKAAATSTKAAATSTKATTTSTKAAATSTKATATSTEAAATSTKVAATSTGAAAMSTKATATSTDAAATSTKATATKKSNSEAGDATHLIAWIVVAFASLMGTAVVAGMNLVKAGKNSKKRNRRHHR